MIRRLWRRFGIEALILVTFAGYAAFVAARYWTLTPSLYPDSYDYRRVRDAISACDWSAVRTGYRPPGFPLLWAISSKLGLSIVPLSAALNAGGAILVSLAGFTLGRSIGIVLFATSSLILLSPAAVSFETTYLTEAVVPGVAFAALSSCILLGRELLRMEKEKASNRRLAIA